MTNDEMELCSEVNELLSENKKLKERIKQLEEILDLDPRTNVSLVDENIQLRKRIKELEEMQPKWIGLDAAKGKDYTCVYQPPKSEEKK